MTDQPGPDLEFVPLPSVGRRYSATRRVRWGDTDPRRRLRLDATARYLQDVANDDTRDAGHDPMAPWVVRRTALAVVAAPQLGELVDLTTFSGGHGRRWAERRTILAGHDGGRIEAAALWVFLDPVSGRPARLTDEFHATYDDAAGGREVGSRLRLPSPPAATGGRPFPLRVADLDGLGHVNNPVAFVPVEEALAERDLTPDYVELEYPGAIEAGEHPEVVVRDRPGAAGTVLVDVWLLVAGEVRAAAHVRARRA